MWYNCPPRRRCRRRVVVAVVVVAVAAIFSCCPLALEYCWLPSSKITACHHGASDPYYLAEYGGVLSPGVLERRYGGE